MHRALIQVSWVYLLLLQSVFTAGDMISAMTTLQDEVSEPVTDTHYMTTPTTNTHDTSPTNDTYTTALVSSSRTSTRPTHVSTSSRATASPVQKPSTTTRAAVSTTTTTPKTTARPQAATTTANIHQTHTSSATHMVHSPKPGASTVAPSPSLATTKASTTLDVDEQVTTQSPGITASNVSDGTAVDHPSTVGTHPSEEVSLEKDEDTNTKGDMFSRYTFPLLLCLLVTFGLVICVVCGICGHTKCRNATKTGRHYDPRRGPSKDECNEYCEINHADVRLSSVVSSDRDHHLHEEVFATIGRYSRPASMALHYGPYPQQQQLQQLQPQHLQQQLQQEQQEQQQQQVQRERPKSEVEQAKEDFSVVQSQLNFVVKEAGKRVKLNRKRQGNIYVMQNTVSKRRQNIFALLSAQRKRENNVYMEPQGEETSHT